MAHETIALENINRGRRFVERLMWKQQEGTIGQPSATPVDGELGDDMGIKIGDEIHYHNPPPSIAQQPVQAVAGVLKKAAIVAALTGTGAAGGLGLPWLAGWFAGESKPAPAATHVDRDTRVGISTSTTQP